MSLPALIRPTLSDPLVVTLPATGYADGDKFTVKAPLDRDVLIRWPLGKTRTGGLRITGGRNVVLAGGHQTIGRNRDGSWPEYGARGVGDTNIAVDDGAGIVHVEGLLVDSSGGAESDGFMLNTNRTVQIMWTRVDNLQGSSAPGHRHADCIQIGPGGVGELRLDHFTGRSHYNSLYARRENSPLGKAHGPLRLRYSNMGGYTQNPIGAPQQTLTGLSLGTQPPNDPGDNGSAVNAELPGDVYLDHYYADPGEAGRPNLGEFLHPDARRNSYQPGRPVADSTGGWYWPVWRGASPGVHGRVLTGPPPSGDYAKADAVGLNYAKGVWA